MWVKICGTTNLNDAQLAIALGADALGFVFAESRRQVTPAQVEQITTRLPAHVERIGVFAGWSPEAVASAVASAGLTGVQLHDDSASIENLRPLLPPAIRLIPVVHWPEDATASDDVELHLHRLQRLDPKPDRILIDSKIGAAIGGTGVPFDWAAAEATFRRPDLPHLILAGGLTAQNVALAIQHLHPWGVDVVSGVEESAGRKSPHKLAAFFAAISH